MTAKDATPSPSLSANSLSIADDFIQTLRCPQTGQPLRALTDSELLSLNGRLLSQPDDGAPKTPLSSALMTEKDPVWVYPVEDGLPVLITQRAMRFPTTP